MEQMDVIEGVGVDLSHVVIGHMATLKPEHDPLATHTAIARRGAFVGLDTLGHEMGRSEIPEADKVRMVQDLLDAGLEDHILFSSDQGNVRQFKRYYGHGWASVLIAVSCRSCATPASRRTRSGRSWSTTRGASSRFVPPA